MSHNRRVEHQNHEVMKGSSLLLGVLTKPERISLGEEDEWLPFLRDEKEPLENSWFCLKQPSSNELKANMTWCQARRAEEKFFSSMAPWSTLEDQYKRYLKTGNLFERLSSVLFYLIKKRMPQIQDELDRSISSARQATSSLPLPPAPDPRSEILNPPSQVHQDLAWKLEGMPDGFDSDDSVGQEKFKRAIRTTAPNFWSFEKAAMLEKNLADPSFLVNKEAGRIFVPQGQRIYVDELLERARRPRTRELPGHYPFIVQKTFIQGILKHWIAPSEALCQSCPYHRI